MLRFILLSSILTLVSCKTTEVVQRVPYNELEYVQFKKAGTAKVTGQAFLRAHTVVMLSMQQVQRSALCQSHQYQTSGITNGIL